MARAVEKRFGRRAEIPFDPAGRKYRLRASSDLEPRCAIRRALFPRSAGDRLAGLDVLRLCAALAVVLFHFGYAGTTRGMMDTGYPGLAPVARYGFLGVDLFFLISGFVIAASATGRTWQQFAAARVLRLYPAYFVCMTATAVVLALLGAAILPPGWTTPVDPSKWLANLTMVAPAFGKPFMDGAYWSIVVEIVFYGWVVVLVAAGVFERRLLAILTIWLGIAYINEVMLHTRVLRLGLVTEYAALFASGILIQRLRAGERNPYAWALLGFAFGLGLIHGFEAQRVSVRLYADALSLPVLWTLHVGLYVVFVGGLWLSRWLPSTRAVLTIGGITYPLYLVHQQAGYVLIDALAPLIGRWEALGLVLSLAIGFAWVVWRWAEPAGRAIMRPVLDALLRQVAGARSPGLQRH